MPVEFDPDSELLKVAYLVSLGERQTSIAALLGLTTSKVSRLVSKAGEEGILEQQAPRLELDPELVQRIKEKLDDTGALVAALQRRERTRCRHIEVVRTETSAPQDGNDSPGSRDENLAFVREVSVGAARYLTEELLTGMNDVGLTWGISLRELAHELARRIQRSSRGSPLVGRLTFHQCTGDTQAATSDPSQRAGTLVAELNHVLGTRGNIFSMGATIPKEFDADVATLRRYHASIPGYSAMFSLHGDSRIALKMRLDAIITGCGSGTVNDTWRDDCARAAGIDANALTEMVVGNVGGTWIPRSPEHEEPVAEINARWNGVSLDDLADTVSRGQEVVLIAAEPAKAEVAARAIEMGCVSTLIASQALVRRMVEALEPDDGTQDASPA